MITFEQLLADPKYREMTRVELREIVYELDFKYYPKGWKKGGYTGENTDKLYDILQKLKAESEKKAEPIYGESPIISHINAIQMGALIEKVAKEFNKPVRFETLTKPEPSIQITDQKAREICAKYFNCNPNEIKIV